MKFDWLNSGAADVWSAGHRLQHGVHTRAATACGSTAPLPQHLPSARNKPHDPPPERCVHRQCPWLPLLKAARGGSSVEAGVGGWWKAPPPHTPSPPPPLPSPLSHRRVGVTRGAPTAPRRRPSFWLCGGGGFRPAPGPMPQAEEKRRVFACASAPARGREEGHTPRVTPLAFVAVSFPLCGRCFRGLLSFLLPRPFFFAPAVTRWMRCAGASSI